MGDDHPPHFLYCKISLYVRINANLYYTLRSFIIADRGFAYIYNTQRHSWLYEMNKNMGENRNKKKKKFLTDKKWVTKLYIHIIRKTLNEWNREWILREWKLLIRLYNTNSTFTICLYFNAWTIQKNKIFNAKNFLRLPNG